MRINIQQYLKLCFIVRWFSLRECFWANPCVWSLWKMYWYEMGYANNGKDEFNYIKWVYKMWEWCCLAPSYEIFEVLFPRLYIQKAFENSNVYFQSFLSWRATVTWICYYKLTFTYLHNSCINTTKLLHIYLRYENLKGNRMKFFK